MLLHSGQHTSKFVYNQLNLCEAEQRIEATLLRTDILFFINIFTGKLCVTIGASIEGLIHFGQRTF